MNPAATKDGSARIIANAANDPMTNPSVASSKNEFLAELCWIDGVQPTP